MKIFMEFSFNLCNSYIGSRVYFMYFSYISWWFLSTSDDIIMSLVLPYFLRNARAAIVMINFCLGKSFLVVITIIPSLDVMQ